MDWIEMPIDGRPIVLKGETCVTQQVVAPMQQLVCTPCGVFLCRRMAPIDCERDLTAVAGSNHEATRPLNEVGAQGEIGSTPVSRSESIARNPKLTRARSERRPESEAVPSVTSGSDSKRLSRDACTLGGTEPELCGACSPQPANQLSHRCAREGVPRNIFSSWSGMQLKYR
jgi:hypothetical protein